MESGVGDEGGWSGGEWVMKLGVTWSGVGEVDGVSDHSVIT